MSDHDERPSRATITAEAPVDLTTLVAPGPVPTAVSRQRFRLSVEAGRSPHQELVTSEPRIVVGSHASADLVLTDPTVSRMHFEIVTDSQGHRLRDLGSKNGTFVAALKIREVYLTDAVQIRAGRAALGFSLLSEADEVPLHPGIRFGSMIARSPVMRALFERLARVAARDTTLLLEGESGTGKELAARAVHEQSRRRDKPFVVVDCSAMPRNLIEAELFGHERGAFTGASQARPGAFARAHGGTIFLDEIGELDLDLQPRLLGALERKEIKPIGASAPLPIDVRVISATNRDLRMEVNRRGFREDLYYRLAVACVTMPPLRERTEDIPYLVEHFLELAGAQTGERQTIDGLTMARMTARSWPGNIRELRNAVEQLLAFGVEDLVAAPSTRAKGTVQVEPFKTSKARVVDQFELEYLTNVLAVHGGQITASANAAEVDRVHFLRLLDKHKLRKPRPT